MPAEVATADLPGTAQDNAGKAIRELFDRIAKREGVSGYDLFYRIRDDAEAFLCEVPSVERAVAIEHCDWGVTPENMASLPHCADAAAFRELLSAAAAESIGHRDAERSMELAMSQLRLARCIATGFSATEASYARRCAERALDAIEQLIDLHVLGSAESLMILDSLAWLEGPDPFGIPARLELESRLLVEAISRDALPDVDIGSDANGVSIRACDIPRSAARPMRDAYARIIAAWNGDNYDGEARAAVADIKQASPVGAYLFSTFQQYHQDQLFFEHRVATVAAQLRSLASP